jgi:hypothetical protein
VGCNCGKTRKPLGPSTKDAVTTAPEPTMPPPPRKPRATTPGSLGAVRGTTQSFALVTTDGRTQSFGSRLEAEAARVRAGSGRVVVA